MTLPNDLNYNLDYFVETLYKKALADLSSSVTISPLLLNVSSHLTNLFINNFMKSSGSLNYPLFMHLSNISIKFVTGKFSSSKFLVNSANILSNTAA